tara:strand:+ start:279 stop:437 length:159 start_codon:yes stop_codon:yes gene_type:complete
MENGWVALSDMSQVDLHRPQGGKDAGVVLAWFSQFNESFSLDGDHLTTPCEH